MRNERLRGPNNVGRAVHAVQRDPTLGSNNDGDGYKTSLKKWIRTASNFMALIPSGLLRQMLANVFGVEF